MRTKILTTLDDGLAESIKIRFMNLTMDGRPIQVDDFRKALVYLAAAHRQAREVVIETLADTTEIKK